DPSRHLRACRPLGSESRGGRHQGGLMRLQVKGKNVEISPAIREYAEAKLAKLNKQLAEQTQVELELWEEKNPSIRASHVAAAAIHGLQRVREWDVVATAAAPGLDGDRASFVALSNGDLVVDEGPSGVEPLAEAVERALPAPYRAEAVRREGELWAVAARAIELVRLPGIPG